MTTQRRRAYFFGRRIPRKADSQNQGTLRLIYTSPNMVLETFFIVGKRSQIARLLIVAIERRPSEKKQIQQHGSCEAVN